MSTNLTKCKQNKEKFKNNVIAWSHKALIFYSKVTPSGGIYWKNKTQKH